MIFIFWIAGCSLWGVKASPVTKTCFKEALASINCNFWSKEMKKKFRLHSFYIFGHQNPGSASGIGSGFTWNAGSGVGFNESGSTTLSRCWVLRYIFLFSALTMGSLQFLVHYSTQGSIFWLKTNIYSPPPLGNLYFFPKKTALFLRNIADDKIA